MLVEKYKNKTCVYASQFDIMFLTQFISHRNERLGAVSDQHFISFFFRLEVRFGSRTSDGDGN